MFRTICSRFTRNLTALHTLRQAGVVVRCASATSSASPTQQDDDEQQRRQRRRQTTAADVADLRDIEAQLFENNARRSAPVDSRALLAKYSQQSGGSAKRRTDSSNRFRRATHKPTPAAAAAAAAIRPAPQPKPARVKSPIVDSTALGLSYTKLHLNDPWLHSLMTQARSRKQRAQRHQLLVEGRRLIVEALLAGLQLDHVLFADIEQMQLLKPHLPAGAQLVKVPQSDLRLWSQLATCPGVMAVFTRPADMRPVWEAAAAASSSPALPLTVVCDQIREPNNVGAVIRTCAAAAVAQVIVTRGCADPWESKALRGGAGAQFRVPVRGPCDWSSIGSMLPAAAAGDECFVYLAENSRENAVERRRRSSPAEEEHGDAAVDLGEDVLRCYSDVNYAQGAHTVLVIGGETEGLSPDAYKLLQRRSGACVQIPLAGGVESLNTGAALAVLLFEMRKQMVEAEAERRRRQQQGV